MVIKHTRNIACNLHILQGIVSCITKCVTEPPIKMMMPRQLEAIDQMCNSIRSMIVIVEL